MLALLRSVAAVSLHDDAVRLASGTGPGSGVALPPQADKAAVRRSVERRGFGE
jgi:hypothetical protein